MSKHLPAKLESEEILVYKFINSSLSSFAAFGIVYSFKNPAKILKRTCEH